MIPHARPIFSLFVTSLLVLAGCSGEKTAETAVPLDQSVTVAEEGVVYHRGNGTEPNTLSPHQANGVWENNIIGDMLIGLYTEDAYAKAVPGAAVSHEVSEDGLTHIFKMREGAVWSDGVPVTAHDFVFAWQTILKPETAAPYASLLYPFKNAAQINAGALPASELGARAIDDMTLELITETPVPFLKTLMTHYTAWPIPKHKVEELGDDWVKPENYVVNGPYKPETWRPNAFVKLIKNDKFYDADNVSIDTIYFYPLDDNAAALRKFRAGELDSNSCSQCYPIQQVKFIDEKMPGVKHDQVMLSTSYLSFNTRKPPFDDVRVRKAVSLSLDRDILTKQVTRAGEKPAYALVPPLMSNYVPAAQRPVIAESALTQEERNQLVQQWLAEAGYDADNPLSFTVTYRLSGNRKSIMVAMQNMWKQQGIIATLDGKEPKVAYADYRARNFEVADAGWVADYDDPDNFLFLAKSDTGPINYSDYNNPEFDALLDKASVTMDLEERANYMAQAEQIMLDDMPMAPTYFSVDLNLVGLHINNWQDNGRGVQRTRWLSIDESKRQRY